MTNGQKIQKIVNKYFKVYKSLVADPQFKEKASELAKHDLWMLKFVYEQAISELTARIMEEEAKEYKKEIGWIELINEPIGK